jgi:hypothetical protein
MGGCRHAAGDFAGERRFVVAAFAGDDDIGGGEPFGESGDAGNDVEAAFDGGAKEGVEPAGETSGRAGPGERAEVDAGGTPGDGGESLERFFEEIDFGGRGALLGREDAGGAVGAAEGRGDVGGHGDGEGAEPRRGAPFDAFEAGEWTTAGWEVGAGCIEEASAEGAECAGAAIGGGAAADADEQARGPFGGGRGDEFADAEAIGAEGIAFGGLEVEEAVGLGRFDDDGAVVAEAEVAPEDPPPEGVVDDGGGGIGADGSPERIEEAGATIGEREEVDFPAWPGGADASSDGGRGFVGGEGTFELLRGDEDAHVS